jgi:hypothetical protein
MAGHGRCGRITGKTEVIHVQAPGMFCRFGSWGRTQNQHRIRIPQFSFGLFSTPSTLRIHSFREPLACAIGPVECHRRTGTYFQYRPTRQLCRNELLPDECDCEFEPDCAQCASLCSESVCRPTSPVPELGSYLLHGELRGPELSGDGTGSHSPDVPWSVFRGRLYLGA